MVIKKTSWKTIKKFLKSLDKDKLVLAKEMKTEVMILDIDFDDLQFKNFTPYRLPNRDKAGTTASNGTAKISETVQTSDSDTSVGQQLKVLNLYKLREEVLALRVAVNSSEKHHSSTTVSSTDLRAIINNYIDLKRLSNPTNKRMITLDEPLSAALFTSSSTPFDHEIRTRGTIPRDALLERIQSNSSQCHMILRNGEEEKGCIAV